MRTAARALKLQESLPSPDDGLWDALEAHGAIISGKGSANPALGRIAPGRYEIAGNVSSQYISGLMFALPLLDGGSQIVLRGGEDSSGYIAMTRDVLRLFSVDAAPSSEGYTLAGNQKYITPAKTVPEGDWSNAAFWLCAAAAGGGTITVGGLSADTAQGDSAVRIFWPVSARALYLRTARSALQAAC